MRSSAADADPRPAPSDILAIVTHDTYMSVLAHALAVADERPPRLTVFTYVPALFVRNFGSMVGQLYSLEQLTAEVRDVELAANALLPHACSVRFIGAGFSPRRELRALLATMTTDAIVTSDRRVLTRRWIRAAAGGRSPVLLAASRPVPAY